MTTLRHEREMQIEWGHCDPAGIVFHPRYLEIFDACANMLFQKASGMTKAAMLRHYGCAGIPVVEAGAKFILPSRYGDTVRVVTRVAEFRRSSFSLRHDLFMGDSLAAEGWSTRVWVVHSPGETEKLVSQALPADLVAQFGSAP